MFSRVKINIIQVHVVELSPAQKETDQSFLCQKTDRFLLFCRTQNNLFNKKKVNVLNLIIQGQLQRKLEIGIQFD